MKSSQLPVAEEFTYHEVPSGVFISTANARKPRCVVGGEPDRESIMTSTHWPLVEVAARLLGRSEREAVLGDLLETGEGTDVKSLSS